MITQDYLALPELAFPEGCTFTAEEMKLVSSKKLKTFVVHVANAFEGEIWRAKNVNALVAALRATYQAKTKVDFSEQVTEYINNSVVFL